MPVKRERDSSDLPPSPSAHSPSPPAFGDPELNPTPSKKRKAAAKPKPKAGKAKVKAEPNTGSGTGGSSDGRTRLVEMVIERGIAAVMGPNSAATQAETGLTAKQIQNHLGKGRSLRARLEEVARGV